MVTKKPDMPTTVSQMYVNLLCAEKRFDYAVWQYADKLLEVSRNVEMS